MAKKKIDKTSEIPNADVFNQELASTEQPEQTEENKKRIQNPQIIMDPDVETTFGLDAAGTSFKESVVFIAKLLLKEHMAINENINSPSLSEIAFATTVALSTLNTLKEYYEFNELVEKSLALLQRYNITEEFRNAEIIFENVKLNELISETYSSLNVPETEIINKNKKGE